MHINRQKRIIFGLGFLVLLQTYFLTNTISAKPVYNPEEDVMDYPYAFNFTFDFGFTNKITMIQRRDKPEDDGSYIYDRSIDKHLRSYRYGLDVNWIQISKFWCKYFGGYPTIGTGIKFTDLEGQGWMGSLLFYFSPQFSYFSNFEFKPKIGLGIVYMNIPLVLQMKIPREEVDEVITNEDGVSYDKMKTVYDDEPPVPVHDDHYRNGIGLETQLGFDLEWRLSPNWVITNSYGIVYIPELESMYEEAAANKEEEREKRKNANLKEYKTWWLFDKDKDIFMFTAGIGVGYMPISSEIEYEFDKTPSSIVKITASFAVKGYDRIAEYGWGLLLKKSAKEYESGDIKDVDVKGLDSVDLNEDRYNTFNVFSINTQWAMKCFDSHAFVLGSEFIFDGANAALIKALKLPNSGALKWGLLVGHDFLYGNFSIGQQLGFYILNSAYSIRLSSIFREIAFVRFNFDYKIASHWVVGVAVRNRLEALYDDMNDPAGAPSFKGDNLYDFSMKVDYPEIYLGYSF